MNSVKLFGIFVVMPALLSCGSKNGMPQPSFGQEPIVLSARVDNVIGRAAVSEFPNAVGNAAQVAIVACKSSALNWSDLAISHAVANVGAATSGYSLSWAEGHSQFWPSNGDALTFMAYSPITAAGTGTSLSISLSETTPDVLIADTKDGLNPITGSKSQASEGVNFLFRHILSQLQVRIKNNADELIITKAEVVVSSAHRSKSYNLTSGMWTTGTGPSEEMTYVSTVKWGGYGNSGAEEIFGTPLLVFPGTQASITIKIYTGYTLFATKKVNEFFDQNNVTASLVSGKKTILTLSVVGNDLSGMTAGVQDWDDLGEFGTVVQ